VLTVRGIVPNARVSTAEQYGTTAAA